MKARNVAVIFTAILGVMLALPLVNATVAWSTPVTFTNHSSDISLVINYVDDTDISNPDSENTTLYYSTDGGSTYISVAFTSFAENDSQVTATLAITAIADNADVDLRISLGNSSDVTANVTVEDIGIDDTNPVNPTPTSTYDRITAGNTLDIFWGTVTDATTGVATVTTTITSPDTSNCPTQTFSTTSGTTQYSGSQETGCTGEYTISTVATDEAGNSVTSTKTFIVDSVGGNIGGNFKDTAKEKDGMSPILIIIVIIIIIAIIRNKNN